jgi:hypothetical protein
VFDPNDLDDSESDEEEVQNFAAMRKKFMGSGTRFSSSL